MEAKRLRLDSQSSDLGDSADDESGSIYSENISENVISNNEKLKALLVEWKSPSFYEILLRNDIDFEKLDSLEDPFYDNLIKNGEESLGNLLLFRRYHMKWKDSISNNSSNNVNVASTLRDGGEKASKIKNFFETNGHLTDGLREDLVSLILQEREYLSKGMMSDIANQICDIFPGEIKSIYYEVRGSQVTGLLFVRYNQLKQKQARLNKKSESSVAPVADLLTDEVKLSKEYVNNEENYHSPFDELFKHWRVTYLFRKSKTCTLQQVLDEWPILKRPDGYVMIHDDFENEYSEAIGNSLTNKWDDLISKNIQIISSGIKNARARRELSSSESESDCGIKNRKILMSLHHVSSLIPKQVTTTKKTWTPSIVCSEEAFLVIVENEAEMIAELKKRNNFCATRGILHHPLMFECKKAKSSKGGDGGDGSEERKYFIGLGDTIYACESLIEALDASFKLFVMFKIPFPPECKRIWIFLNEIFYKINLQEKPNYKIISSLNSYKF